MITFLFIFFASTTSFSKEISGCQKWFDALKIVTVSGCESYCSVASTDMSTFACKEECPKLCKNSFKKNETLLLYPLLNEEEKKLSERYPIKAFKAYKLSYAAESICTDLFFKSKTNDASDACRHFVWSYLMASQIDISFAKDVLAAHESEPFQPKEDREMDLKNNSFGFSYYDLKKDASSLELKNKFTDLIRKKELIVISPDITNWRKK